MIAALSRKLIVGVACAASDRDARKSHSQTQRDGGLS